MSGTVYCPICAAPLDVAVALFERLRCAACQGEFVLQVAPAQAPIVPVRRIAPPEPPRQPAMEASDTGPRDTFRSDSPETGRRDTWSGSQETAPREAPTETATQRPGRSRKRAPTARRRTAGSGCWLQHILGIAGGGFLGIAAGYYLLNYFGGPQFDFLHIPLPLVVHTQGGAWPLTAAAAAAKTPTASPDSRPQNQPADAEAPAQVQPDEAPGELPPDLLVADAPDEAGDEMGGVTESSPRHLPPPDAESPATVLATATSPGNAPRYSVDDLTQALASIRHDTDCQHCESTGFRTRVVITGFRDYRGRRTEQTAEKRFPCQFCRGRAGDINQSRYGKLCRLAEVLTFVDLSPDDPNFAARRQEIEAALRAAVGCRERADSIGRLAGHWLDAGDREAEGVLLAGTVQKVESCGPYFLSHLVLFGLPKVVLVASLASPPYRPHDRLLIAGSIIEHPARNLEGYVGNQPQVVWGGFPLPLPDAWR